MISYLKPTIISLSLGLLLSFCGRNDVDCKEAYLIVHNPDTAKGHVVIYGFGTNHPEDTIWPGESIVKVYENVFYKKTLFTESSQTFIEYWNGIQGSTIIIPIEQCLTEMDAPSGHVDLSAHCRDGQFQPELGELMKDCGGQYCPPCSEVSFNCSPPYNTMQFNSYFFDAESRYTFITTYESSIEFEFDFGISNTLRVSLKMDKVPTNERAIPIGYDDYEAYVTYRIGSSEWSASSNQEIYVVLDDYGNPFFKFCDLHFVGGSSGGFFTASGYLDIENN